MTDWGGYWTEVKLEVLRKYLVAFNTASTRAGATVYLDLFAGRLAHRRPDTGTEHSGSWSADGRTHAVEGVPAVAGVGALPSKCLEADDVSREDEHGVAA